jgi:anaerobic selenocysteine-containing dehydrogenase
VIGDTSDNFMGPDNCARLYTSDNSKVLNYTRWYHTIHRLADVPGPVYSLNTASPHFVADPNSPGNKISYAGRFPSHTEPYESPQPTLAANTNWGANTKGTAVGDLLPAGTSVGTVADFPLVLTTIRCVEHFQGGPITRNNWFNVELEPEPWIEINSADARTYGIANDDYVRVVTARTESLPGHSIAGSFPAAVFGAGFRARVGTGLAAGQKIGVGVVGIPWHWGEAGLSTGSRANDLTIDAMDANTAIPEYKACLCRIEKM